MTAFELTTLFASHLELLITILMAFISVTSAFLVALYFMDSKLGTILKILIAGLYILKFIILNRRISANFRSPDTDKNKFNSESYMAYRFDRIRMDLASLFRSRTYITNITIFGRNGLFCKQTKTIKLGNKYRLIKLR